MRITPHGFSSLSVGSRYVKIYNVLALGSTEARPASVQLGRFLFHRQGAESNRAGNQERSTYFQACSNLKRSKYRVVLNIYPSSIYCGYNLIYIAALANHSCLILQLFPYYSIYSVTKCRKLDIRDNVI